MLYVYKYDIYISYIYIYFIIIIQYYQFPSPPVSSSIFTFRTSETFQDLAMQNAIGPGDEGNVRCSQLLSHKIRPFDPALD